MKTTKIKANLVKLPLIGCPGAEGASWALPADADSYERMVEQMAFALGRRKWFKTFPARKEFADEIGNKGLDVWIEEVQTELRAQARFALRAIGITAPKKGRK